MLMIILDVFVEEYFSFVVYDVVEVFQDDLQEDVVVGFFILVEEGIVIYVQLVMVDQMQFLVVVVVFEVIEGFECVVFVVVVLLVGEYGLLWYQWLDD